MRIFFDILSYYTVFSCLWFSGHQKNIKPKKFSTTYSTRVLPIVFRLWSYNIIYFIILYALLCVFNSSEYTADYSRERKLNILRPAWGVIISLNKIGFSHTLPKSLGRYSISTTYIIVHMCSILYYII